ncbi:MAG: AAA family ATPase [Xanthomonadaceae bacterium]|nr:AAA family ATPase [Xanthomonadaceae bacterium]MDP2185050.1 AAA family ATPase [Xanthomonadales bacterium]MDZ4114429.1 AAA family ATPase [Xanthomonadaceae bacterium]
MNTATVTPLRATDDEARDVRAQVRGLMQIDRTLSQARIAKESGLSTTVVSQWLSGTYPGDNAAVEAKLQRWIDTTQAQREHAARLPAAPDYVATPSSERVIAALTYAQVAGDIAVIYGGAGLGKTSAIRAYARRAPNVWHCTMTPASASVATALEEIAEAVGAGAATGGAAKLFRAVCKRADDSAGLLVIDEAQHLSIAALDQIRAIHDATGIGIALVGNESVYARLTGGNRAAYLDRLYSRIGKRIRLTKSTQADAVAILAAWDIDEKPCRAQLIDIASRPGGLRGLTKVLRLGSMYAAAEGRTLCCDDVRAAWRELGGEA